MPWTPDSRCKDTDQEIIYHHTSKSLIAWTAFKYTPPGLWLPVPSPHSPKEIVWVPYCPRVPKLKYRYIKTNHSSHINLRSNHFYTVVFLWRFKTVLASSYSGATDSTYILDISFLVLFERERCIHRSLPISIAGL